MNRMETTHRRVQVIIRKDEAMYTLRSVTSPPIEVRGRDIAKLLSKLAQMLSKAVFTVEHAEPSSSDGKRRCAPRLSDDARSLLMLANRICLRRRLTKLSPACLHAAETTLKKAGTTRALEEKKSEEDCAMEIQVSEETQSVLRYAMAMATKESSDVVTAQHIITALSDWRDAKRNRGSRNGHGRRTKG